LDAISEDGEVLCLTEVAKSIVPPKYWRRAEGIIEGDPGPEYEEAFLNSQKEIGPLISMDGENDFNKSKYTTLPHLIRRIVPIANKHGITLKQGCGKIVPFGGFDNPKRTLLLPVFTQARHAVTGQWERVYIEMPLAKIDPQGFGSAFSYGRRYALQAFWQVAGTDDDGALASLKSSLDGDPTSEAAAGMIEQINDCRTLEALKAWQERNAQGFDLLEEAVITKLREAYGKRQAVLKAELVVVDEVKPRKTAKAVS
jgi:ERF superfamily